MALSDGDVARFRGPAVWRESDCVEWLYAITDMPRSATSVWHRCKTHERALARARRVHGSYAEAVMHWLRIRGYRELDVSAHDFAPGDVVIVDDPTYGVHPAGVSPGPQLIIRHQHGLAEASGRVLHHMRAG